MTSDEPIGEGPAPSDADGGAVGRRIIRASWVSTIAFTMTTVVASIWLGVWRWPALVVALVMFAAGCVVFLWAFAVAVGRSRTDSIGIGGLFFLAGTSTSLAQRHLMGSLILQVGVAIGAASARTFTTLAFGALAPLFGLGMAGLWGAKFGTFGPRDPRD